MEKWRCSCKKNNILVLFFVVVLVGGRCQEDEEPPDSSDRHQTQYALADEMTRCNGISCEAWERYQKKRIQLQMLQRQVFGENFDPVGVMEREGTVAEGPMFLSKLELQQYYFPDESLVPESEIDDQISELLHTARKRQIAAPISIYLRQLYRPTVSRRYKRAGLYTTYAGYWFPKTKPIGYAVTQDIRDSERSSTTLRAALKAFEKETCFRFKEKNLTEAKKFNNNPDNDVIWGMLFQGKKRGCFSWIGKSPKVNVINLSPPCFNTIGTPLHEIFHSLGYAHEQCRPDRENTIEFVKKNFGGRYVSQFKKAPLLVDNPYDLSSVMHYGSTHCSKNGKVCMKPLNPLYRDNMYNRKYFSFWDLKLINTRKDYCGCDRSPVEGKCARSGYPDPNNCSICKCPPGFSSKSMCKKRAKSNRRRCGETIKLQSNGKEATVHMRKYNLNTECNWHIQSASDRRIELRFVKRFDIWSWVEVAYEKDLSMGPRFAGRVRPKKAITSEGSEMMITVRSHDMVGHGMTAIVRAVNMDGSLINAPTTTSTTTTPKPTTTTRRPTTTSKPSETGVTSKYDKYKALLVIKPIYHPQSESKDSNNDSPATDFVYDKTPSNDKKKLEDYAQKLFAQFSKAQTAFITNSKDKVMSPDYIRLSKGQKVAADVMPDSLPASDIAPGPLPASDIAPGPLPASDIAPGPLPASDIAPGPLPASDIAPGPLPASDIAPGPLPASDFAPGPLPASDVPQYDAGNDFSSMDVNEDNAAENRPSQALLTQMEVIEPLPYRGNKQKQPAQDFIAAEDNTAENAKALLTQMEVIEPLPYRGNKQFSADPYMTGDQSPPSYAHSAQYFSKNSQRYNGLFQSPVQDPSYQTADSSYQAPPSNEEESIAQVDLGKMMKIPVRKANNKAQNSRKSNQEDVRDDRVGQVAEDWKETNAFTSKNTEHYYENKDSKSYSRMTPTVANNELYQFGRPYQYGENRENDRSYQYTKDHPIKHQQLQLYDKSKGNPLESFFDYDKHLKSFHADRYPSKHEHPQQNANNKQSKDVNHKNRESMEKPVDYPHEIDKEMKSLGRDMEGSLRIEYKGDASKTHQLEYYLTQKNKRDLRETFRSSVVDHHKTTNTKHTDTDDEADDADLVKQNAPREDGDYDSSLDNELLQKALVDESSQPIPAMSTDSFSCGFETGSLCDMLQTSDRDFAWHIQSGTSSDLHDGHLTANRGSYFAYIKARTYMRPGKQADMLLLPVRTGGDFCLKFKYHVCDQSKIILKVYSDWTVEIWQSAVTGEGWKETELAIQLSKGAVLDFRALLVQASDGHAAIDDISLHKC